MHVYCQKLLIGIAINVDCTYDSAWLVDVRDSDELGNCVLWVVRTIYMQALFINS